MSRLSQNVFFVVLIAIFCCSCRKDVAPLQPPYNIEGAWTQASPVSPEWHYRFDRGLLTQTAVAAGNTIWEYQFPYATRGDTVLIGGDSLNAPRTWVLDWWCDSVVECHIQQAIIAPRLLLRRE